MCSHMDNISGFSEIDFTQDMEAHTQIGSNEMYQVDLEGDPGLSSSDKTVSEKHNSSSKSAKAKSEKMLDLESKVQGQSHHAQVPIRSRSNIIIDAQDKPQDHSKTAKDRKAKAETALQTRLHSSLSALDLTS